jgi:hypothetical protein
MAGVVVSLLAFRLVHAATGLPMLFRPTTAAMVLLLTVLMCISPAFAARGWWQPTRALYA